MKIPVVEYYRDLLVVFIFLLVLLMIGLSKCVLDIFRDKSKCELQLTNEVNDVTSEVCSVIINENDNPLSEEATQIVSIVNKKIKKKKEQNKQMMVLQLNDE